MIFHVRMDTDDGLQKKNWLAGIIFRYHHNGDLPIRWNIAPTQDVFAIRFNPETKRRSLDVLRW
jgi:hypothetical protein